MNIMVFDTETINLDKPFIYNIGYVIYDTDTAEILVTKDFVVEQVWHNPMLFVTAYYANKKDIYISRMRKRSCIMDKFGYITQRMYRDIKEYDVQHAFAYNSPFDVRAFDWNCDWFKCINPFDTVQVHDIRGQVHKKFAFTKAYQDFCDEHGLYSDSGNYSTTAETAYKFVTKTIDFVEEHTALADSLIELEILVACVNGGEDWTADYTVYKSIAKTQLREFEVIDNDGVSHKFPYTHKRKISGVDGVRLQIKEEGV